MIEYNKIYCMDCLEGMKQLGNNEVDLILTDIPYGEVNRDSNGLRILDKADADVVTFDLLIFLEECVRVCKGSIYVFCGTEQVSYIREILVKKGLSTRLIIWEKTNPSPMNGKVIWLSGIECCVFGKKPKAVFNAFCKNTVLRYSCGRKKYHPTQKNIDLFKELIEISSNPNNLVLDPCMGSGTTALACKQLGRNFLGFEINQDYVNIANKRLKEKVEND